jgi:hypothetical protein
LNGLKIPKIVEVIIADDGSNPKPKLYDEPNFRYQFVYRANKQKGWTIPHILNYGAKFAHGRYIMFLGIDHMISPEWISYAQTSEDDYAVFTRKCALLTEHGELLRIQYQEEDCEVAYTSIGWVKAKLFRNVGGFNEDVNGINRDVNFFRNAAEYVGKSREYFVRRSPTFVYMLPEKKEIQSVKGRKGEHWKLMSHLRPVHYLHRLPDRTLSHRDGVDLPFDPPENVDELFSFIKPNGARSIHKFSDLVTWKYPSEVAWMQGDYR